MPYPSGNKMGRKLFKQFGFTTRPQIVKKSGPTLQPSAVGGLKGIDKRVGVGGRKRKQKKKAQGQHQRINIRRSIRKGGLEGMVGGL